jgi:hypothetical protein
MRVRANQLGIPNNHLRSSQGIAQEAIYVLSSCIDSGSSVDWWLRRISCRRIFYTPATDPRRDFVDHALCSRYSRQGIKANRVADLLA